MDTFENGSRDSKAMAITAEMKDHIAEAVKWAKFLAIMGYIGLCFLALLGIFLVLDFAAMPDRVRSAGLGVFYLSLVVVYFFPVRYLHNFSNHTKNGLVLNDESSVVLGFGNLKSMFKFLGIYTIVLLSLYVVVLLGLMIFAGLSVL